MQRIADPTYRKRATVDGKRPSQCFAFSPNTPVVARVGCVPICAQPPGRWPDACATHQGWRVLTVPIDARRPLYFRQAQLGRTPPQVHAPPSRPPPIVHPHTSCTQACRRHANHTRPVRAPLVVSWRSPWYALTDFGVVWCWGGVCRELSRTGAGAYSRGAVRCGGLERII